MYDVDAKSYNLDDHDFIGECKTTLGQIVSGGTFMADLMNAGMSGINKSYGTLVRPENLYW